MVKADEATSLVLEQVQRMSESSEERKPPSLSRPEDLVDRMIGEFHLLRRLGSGGMAEVYLAEQPSLDRLVAVKILQPDRVAGFDRSMVERFEREAKAAGGLNHSNIVQVYQTGQDQGIHFIVQEFIQGNNLAQQIKRDGPPELQQGLQWMQQIAEALNAANESGIVHRDIKPENIMLTRELVAKVADFGLAQLNQQADQKNLTQTGTTMGTPLYMSPEQIRGEKVDHRSDQYSFGVTCYHMFAGQPPFSSGNSVTIAVQHLQDDPPPLAGHRVDLPVRLCEIVHRMMAKKPEDRFQSTQDVLSAIQAVHHLPVNTGQQWAGGIGGWLRDSLPGWGAGLVGFLAAVGIGIFGGIRMTSSVGLPEIRVPAVNKRDTAAAQFAAAMLKPDSEAAWMAVSAHYPDSVEGHYAQLHLGLLYLNQVPAELQRAAKVLAELENWTTANPDEDPRLRVLTFVAHARLAAELGQDTAEEAALDQLFDEDLLSSEEFDELIESAPRILRTYWNQRQRESGPPSVSGPGRQDGPPPR